MAGVRDASTVVTHISSLGEDLVREIFIRLSSFATLVRAALTCRAWRRAVASSPDFRRRFRALHPAPPLLGIFIDTISDGTAPYRPPCVPSFVPAGFRDWDLACAVRGGDFFLTSLLERSTKNSSPRWETLDCRGGRILLTDTLDEDKPLVVLNPLIRSIVHEFRYPGPNQYQITTRFISLDEEPLSSFRVAVLAYGGGTLQPSVYSSDTGEWSALPDVDIPARSADGTSSGEASDDKEFWINHQHKMHANGFVYWIYVWRAETGYGVDGMYLISLDTTTMEFSFAKLPQCLPTHDHDWRSTLTFHASEAEDGAACIVYSDGSTDNYIGVLKHTKGDDGVDRWVPDRLLRFGVMKHAWSDYSVDGWFPDRVLRVELDEELKGIHLGDPCSWNRISILAVRDGYVYFATSEMLHDPRGVCWFMSLCLATKKVEKLFERRYDGDANVYIMPWPPCLLASNYGQFAFEGAP